MMSLITGQPGAGKTLHLIWLVKALAEKEGRPVFYTGIPDLTLDWQLLEDPHKWFECPVGSIIVFDEGQKQFRPRGAGSPVPESVAKFETHRHSGYDIFIATQHPMLIDSNVRRLCGRHIHVMRAFGSKAANIHEWGEVRENCDKQRLGSQSKLWKYPTEVFTYYKSAELHTHKFRPPMRLLVLVFAPFLLGGAIWFAVTWFSNFNKPRDLKKSDSPVSGSSLPSLSSSGAGSSKVIPHSLPYADQFIPAVPGLAFTAPRYESVAAPVSAPYPVGCFLVDSQCRCVTDQATRLDVPSEMCNSLVATGFYKDWESSGRAGGVHHRSDSVAEVK